MARKFSDAGLPSVAVTGDDLPAARAHTLRELQEGRLRAVFSVEVLGEGVDVPNVDCVLLLRPTASATLFAQQLGRGLRRAAGKSHLTVIDLIGQHRREFRFEDRLRAMLDTRRGQVVEQVIADFPFLPAGCTVDLDRQSREIILDNLKAAVRRSRWQTLVSDLRGEPDGTTLLEFLDRRDHRLEDVYRGDRSWTRLRREAGHSALTPTDADLEQRSLRALGRLTHVDDPERISFYRELLSQEAAPREQAFDERHGRLLTMLGWGLGSGATAATSLAGYFADLWKEAAVRAELLELLDVLDARSRTRSRPAVLPPEIPLTLHARYSRQEIIAALGFGDGVKPNVTQGGILWVPQARERRLLRRPSQSGARLLADHDVSRLRHQSRTFPLGVAVPADTAAADGPALHQPRRGRDPGAAVRS